jgi:hypothetical protein
MIEMISFIWRKLKAGRRRKLALRIARKREWVEYRGGKCARCGYSTCLAALCFHHTGAKRFSISGGGDSKYDISRGTSGHTKQEIYQELDRCILLCFNCHQELHSNLWDLKDLVQVTLTPRG